MIRALYPLLSGRAVTDEEMDIETRLITNGYILALERDMFRREEDTERILAHSMDYRAMTFQYSTFAGSFTGDRLPAILSAKISVLYNDSTVNILISVCDMSLGGDKT